MVLACERLEGFWVVRLIYTRWAVTVYTRGKLSRGLECHGVPRWPARHDTTDLPLFQEAWTILAKLWSAIKWYLLTQTNKTKKTTKMPLLKPILIVCVSHTVRMIQNVLACSFVRSEIGSGESQHNQGFSVIKLYPWLDQVQYSVRVWEKCLLPKRISLAMWHKDNCHVTQPLLKNFVLNVRTKLFAVRFLIFTSWSILLD